MLYDEQGWHDAYFYTGACSSRLQVADYAALAQSAGGFRRFRSMAARFLSDDDALGRGAYVAYSEQLLVDATDVSNMFVALMSCSLRDLLPMKLQVPQPPPVRL